MNNLREPLVSVLLPSYNHEQYIQAAIESVYQQAYQNIELIVIDDGSTDNSVEILTQLQKKYGFVFVQQENKGLIATLEKLGGLANGEYISLFSSDDLYHPNKIDTLVSYLENNKQFSMVYSKIALINSQTESKQVIDEPYQEGDIFFKLLCGDFFINGLATLVRADVYFSHTRMNSYIDDLQFWLALSRHNQIGFVDKVTAYYRVHNNHLSKDLIKMQKSEFDILMQYSDVKNFSIALNKWYLRWFRAFALCYKIIAIQKFLMKVVMSRNLFSLSFIKGIVRLCLPCKLK
jgi:alpha-1,3-rhamnosyltransferase